MAKKKEIILPSTCGECRHSSPAPSREGDPEIIYCKVQKRRFVKNCKRICDYAE